ncbi:MAG: hypothetical protein ACLFVU_02110 [Phycisphaerae bacterium]
MSTQIAKRGGGFALQPQDMDQAMRMADMLAHSKMVPKGYQGQPQDTLVAMMMGSELGLNPIQALQNIAVINGKPSIYGDALLALVQSHPAFGGIKEEFDEQLMLAKCSVKRKGSDHWHTATFSMADAKQAGLWGKPGPWQTYQKRMLQMRARGFALRDTFADALAGLITAEEAEDMPADERPAPPRVEVRPTYPDDEFSANFPTWQGYIEAGKITVESLINKIQTKGELTDDQLEQLRALEPDVQPAEEAAS